MIKQITAFLRVERIRGGRSWFWVFASIVVVVVVALIVVAVVAKNVVA